MTFKSNRIKKNDRHYLFVWKIREMEGIERTPKINQDYKRNSWWSCISILACRYKSKMVFDNVLKICRMEMKNQNIYLKPRSLMILLPYVIRWWIMENLSLSIFSLFCSKIEWFWEDQNYCVKLEILQMQKNPYSHHSYNSRPTYFKQKLLYYHQYG